MPIALLIGNGAREHALAEALTRSGKMQLATYAKANNPGIAALSTHYRIGSLKDKEAIAAFAREVAPEFAVIGPDDQIADGLADMLEELGIISVAPLKSLARLEWSKSFARDLMARHRIAGNPEYRVFTAADAGEVRDFIRSLGGHYVVKADGLMGGKGVKVSGDHLPDTDDGVAYAWKCIENDGSVVVEEKLVGQEFSLMSFVDGTTVVDMVPVQDHKRAYVGDKGPNTGGMGSYSCADHSLPFLKKSDLEQAHAITVKIAKALKEETGLHYRGVMYGGFMAVAHGVRVIEYNARFGDPEAMNVLPILKTDFVDICRAIVAGTLADLKVEFEPKATVCKYLVPDGYPDAPKSGEKITVDASPQDGARMYYSSVDKRSDGIYLSSSRALAFVGVGDDLAAAEAAAEAACARVHGPVFHREDVGTQALIDTRIAMMQKLRG